MRKTGEMTNEKGRREIGRREMGKRKEKEKEKTSRLE